MVKTVIFSLTVKNKTAYCGSQSVGTGQIISASVENLLKMQILGLILKRQNQKL